MSEKNINAILYDEMDAFQDSSYESFKDLKTAYDGAYDMEYTGKLQQVNGYIICEKVIEQQLLKSQQNNKLQYIAKTKGLFGEGIYLYEGNYPLLLDRAGKSVVSGFQNPVVLGIKVQLGHCLDLLERDKQYMIQHIYTELNKGNARINITDTDVINELNKQVKATYMSFRWLDTDNKPMYKNSTFLGCNIRLCIKDTRCIVGYFEPKHT